jgi:hypothetical protein
MTCIWHIQHAISLLMHVMEAALPRTQQHPAAVLRAAAAPPRTAVLFAATAMLSAEQDSVQLQGTEVALGPSCRRHCWQVTLVEACHAL